MVKKLKKNYETERDEKDLILGNNFAKTNDRKEQLEYIFQGKRATVKRNSRRKKSYLVDILSFK
jgi:hypothetical protein